MRKSASWQGLTAVAEPMKPAGRVTRGVARQGGLFDGAAVFARDQAAGVPLEGLGQLEGVGAGLGGFGSTLLFCFRREAFEPEADRGGAHVDRLGGVLGRAVAT